MDLYWENKNEFLEALIDDEKMYYSFFFTFLLESIPVRPFFVWKHLFTFILFVMKPYWSDVEGRHVNPALIIGISELLDQSASFVPM